MSTSVTTSGLTFADGSVQLTAANMYKNAVSFSSSGTWIVPAGVTQLIATIIGGGGGGGNGNSHTVGGGDSGSTTYNYPGGNGGDGGSALISIAVTPGDTITFTIGAGGAARANGSTSSVTINGTTYTATGGTAGGNATTTSSGTSGTKGTGDGNWNGWGMSIMTQIPVSLECYLTLLTICTGSLDRLRAANSSAALAWSISLSPRLVAGANGYGGASSSADAVGGVGGALVIVY